MLKVDKEKLEIREHRERENSIVVHRFKTMDDLNHKLKILEGETMTITGFNRRRRMEAQGKVGGDMSKLKMIDLRNRATSLGITVPPGVKSKKDLIALIEAEG